MNSTDSHETYLNVNGRITVDNLICGERMRRTDPNKNGDK